MTPSTNSASVNTSAQADPIAIRRQAAIFLIIEFLLIFAPLIILGVAINWPASLDEPASVNLPLILEQYMAMMIGYSTYLVYSLLFWPMAYLTGRAIVIGDTENTLFRVASGFAALSALARVLGIVRWLFAMPVLARLYTNSAVSEDFKESISMVYEMLNAYAGGDWRNIGGEFICLHLVGASQFIINSLVPVARLVGLLWIGGGGFAAVKSVRSGRDRHGGNDYCLGDPATFLDAGHSHCIPTQEGITIPKIC
jgi:hypothetical protein